jgi:hypothetical protein
MVQSDVFYGINSFRMTFFKAKLAILFASFSDKRGILLDYLLEQLTLYWGKSQPSHRLLIFCEE